MAKITKEQYEFALARIEELLPMVDDNTPANDEEECVGMVSEPAVGYSAKTAVPVVEFKHPDGYDGFYTEDPAEFETYKSELIAEAMNDGIGSTWNEVRQQIRDRHLWLR